MNTRAALLGACTVLMWACVSGSGGRGDVPEDSGPNPQAAPAHVGEAPPAQAGGGAAQPLVTGKVESFGISPAVSVAVRSANGEAVRVEGPLTEEIGRLVGARVAVFGTGRTGGPMRQVVADRYDLLEVDGAVPFVGLVHVADGGVWLEADRRLALKGAVEALTALAGAKIYVIGTLSGDTVVVASFGVIKPAP